MATRARPCGQPQAGPAFDAKAGTGRHGVRSNTSKPHPQHTVYPYLLWDLDIHRPNQVWSTDITYIRLAHGFVYLVAVIDWYRRKVLSWRLSNTMDAGFCVGCLEESIQAYGKPEIFNIDQGSQFTSDSFDNEV